MLKLCLSIEELSTERPKTEKENEAGELGNTQRQSSTVPPKRRHNRNPPKSQRRKRSNSNHRGTYEPYLPRKKPHLSTLKESKEDIKAKIEKSEQSISRLQAHSKNKTCPKTLRYNARASIAPDEEFKRDIKLVRAEAEQKYVGALIKFHYRRVERNKIKLRKLEQETRRSTVMTAIEISQPLLLAKLMIHKKEKISRRK